MASLSGFTLFRIGDTFSENLVLLLPVLLICLLLNIPDPSPCPLKLPGELIKPSLGVFVSKMVDLSFWGFLCLEDLFGLSGEEGC